MTTAAEILARVRRDKGVSMSAMAEMADVAASTVSRIENGRFEPTYRLLAQVIEASGFHIRVEVCLDGCLEKES
ncbi:helix-turn-helix transcriptional regulator [Myceligenerans crystallogenes]|uniref:HTH cro/C1-type domain-containing protein n=1 Tax=Myceligenerans crystallogenes TaxID=316335 RepID=A0ABN2NMZ8_9MICO